jgi:SAM-dependent methyltransferase
MLPEEIRRALKEIFRVNNRNSLLRILRGVDYSRCVEYSLVLVRLKPKKGDLVLDVGSRDSIFPQLLSSLGCTVVALDVDPIVRRQLMLSPGGQKINVLIADARWLPIRKSCFDKVTVISTLEHIDNESSIVRNCARVLKPGGCLVITVPFSFRGFFETRMGYHSARIPIRFYDDSTLWSRLIRPSGLDLERLIFFGDNGFYRIWYNPILLPLRIGIMGWLTKYLAPRFFNIYDWQNRDKAGGVCIILRKQHAL